jgi:hypothetical protein
MQWVLYDVMRADEMGDHVRTKDSSLGIEVYTDAYQQIFGIHKISREDFTRSMNYYEGRPEEFKPILDSIQNISERFQHMDEGAGLRPVVPGSDIKASDSISGTRLILDSLRKKRQTPNPR